MKEQAACPSDEDQKATGAATTLPVGTDSGPKKTCSSCGERLPISAIVCRQCRNYQGGYWWLRTFGVGLPWLTTLASITLLALKSFSTYESPKKEISVAISHITPLHITFSFVNSLPDARLIQSALIDCYGKGRSLRGKQMNISVPFLDIMQTVPPVPMISGRNVTLVDYSVRLDAQEHVRLMTEVTCEIRFEIQDFEGLYSQKKEVALQRHHVDQLFDMRSVRRPYRRL